MEKQKYMRKLAAKPIPVFALMGKNRIEYIEFDVDEFSSKHAVNL